MSLVCFVETAQDNKHLKTEPEDVVEEAHGIKESKDNEDDIDHCLEFAHDGSFLSMNHGCNQFASMKGLQNLRCMHSLKFLTGQSKPICTSDAFCKSKVLPPISIINIL